MNPAKLISTRQTGSIHQIAFAPMTQPSSDRFLDRLKRAGITASDSEEEQLNKSLLVFATGLISITSILWLIIYWILGPQLSATMPFTYQVLLTANLLLYIRTGNFDLFRLTQLALFLFAPFVMQWTIGNFINSSGVILWALVAPFGAMLCFGVHQSIGWFIAWVVLTLFSGTVDYLLLGSPGVNQTVVPLTTSVAFFTLNFISVATILFVLLRYSMIEKQNISARFTEAHALLQYEQDRSEKLLLNILPEAIAARLKEENETIADGFANVTVMFADIVDFTQMAAHLPPQEVFTVLNHVFSACDELAEHYGLEKIKTIGDAYMVAGGLDNTNKDYSVAMANLALAMRELLQRNFSINNVKLDMHIGISSGPIVAGVLGKKKFIYDLWGDTVNLASRITERAPPGTILCDEPTYKKLRGQFTFEPVSVVSLKGRGDADVYALTGRRSWLEISAEQDE